MSKRRQQAAGGRYRGPLGFKLPRVVPWTAWSEWVDVYHWLFSGDTVNRYAGVERVKAWSSRGKVPLSVEATANLVEITLHDIFPPTRSENELRLLYSMALIRFVNGLVEKEQGSNAKSVALLAESLNLPRVLVDLRHAATHKTLPSLPALRHGCLSSLTWIDQAYWRKQERQVVDVKTVVHYRLNRYETLGGSDRSLSKCMKKIVEKVSVNHVTTILIPYLMDHMIPETPRPLNEIINCWSEPVARFTSEWPHFLPSLLIALIDQLSVEVYKAHARGERARADGSSSAGTQKIFFISIIAKWLKYLLKTRRFVEPLKDSLIEMPFSSLLDNLLSMPHKSAVGVAKKLLPLVHLKKGFRVKLKRIMQLHPEQFSAESKKRKRDTKEKETEPEELDLHTLQAKFEEHKQHSAQQGHQRKRPKRTNPGQSDLTEGWTLCETWKTCPLGMLPPNKVPDLQFPSEFDKMCGVRYLVPKKPQQQPIHPPPGPAHEDDERDSLPVEDDDWTRPSSKREEDVEPATTGDADTSTPQEVRVELLFPVQDLLAL